MRKVYILGTAEAERHLIEAGAGVNAREKSREQTALMWATALEKVSEL